MAADHTHIGLKTTSYIMSRTQATPTLQFLDVFKNSFSADIALSDWSSRTPPAVAAQHVNVSEATIPKDKPEVMLERS